MAVGHVTKTAIDWATILVPYHVVKSLQPTPAGQNGRHFADDIFRCIFVTEKFSIFRVSSGQGKVREIPDLAKVREKSGNFVEGQGKSEYWEKSGKSQGICI